jgi:hypothetical protein
MSQRLIINHLLGQLMAEDRQQSSCVAWFCVAANHRPPTASVLIELMAKWVLLDCDGHLTVEPFWNESPKGYRRNLVRVQGLARQ